MKKLILLAAIATLTLLSDKAYAPSIGGGSIGGPITHVGVPQVSSQVVTAGTAYLDYIRARDISADSVRATRISGDVITIGGGYTLPTGDPSDNYIIKFDAGTGNLIWEIDSGTATESDTLDSVVERGSVTTRILNVGGLYATGSVTAPTVSAKTVFGGTTYIDGTLGTSNVITSHSVTASAITCMTATIGGYTLPTAAPSGDNYILKYDSGTGTVKWEADATGGGTDEGLDGTVENGSVTSRVLSVGGLYATGTVSAATVSAKTVSLGQTYVDGILGCFQTVTGRTVSAGTVRTFNLIGDETFIKVGDSGATTNRGLSTNDDMFIQGKLEVDGFVYFEDETEFIGTAHNDSAFVFHRVYGGQYYGVLRALQDDGLHFGLGGAVNANESNRNLIFTDYANQAKDHDHDTVSPHPTIFLHSLTNPDDHNDEWLSFSHNTYMGEIKSEKGRISFDNENLATTGTVSASTVSGNTINVGGGYTIEPSEYALRVNTGSTVYFLPFREDKECVLFGPDSIEDELIVFHVDKDKYPFGITLTNLQITLPSDAAYSLPFEEWSGDPPTHQADCETVTTGAADAYAEVRGVNIDNAFLDPDDYLVLHVPATDVDYIHAKWIYRIHAEN